MNADLIYSSSDSSSSASLMFPGLTSSFPDKYWIALDVFQRLFGLLLFLCVLDFFSLLLPVFRVPCSVRLASVWCECEHRAHLYVGGSVLLGKTKTHFSNILFINSLVPKLMVRIRIMSRFFPPVPEMFIIECFNHHHIWPYLFMTPWKA